MSDRGDGGHVKQLTGVILNAAEHDHGDGITFLLDGPQDVLRPQSLLPLSKFIRMIHQTATSAPDGEAGGGVAALPGVAAAVARSP